MDGPEKRPHVVTGNTPNKPTEKRLREQEVGSVLEERHAKKREALCKRCLFNSLDSDLFKLIF